MYPKHTFLIPYSIFKFEYLLGLKKKKIYNAIVCSIYFFPRVRMPDADPPWEKESARDQPRFGFRFKFSVDKLEYPSAQAYERARPCFASLIFFFISLSRGRKKYCWWKKGRGGHTFTLVASRSLMTWKKNREHPHLPLRNW